ncbi:MAG: hypothetical protein HRU12_09890 [Phaeodactylibacter sp.]|nr:hypothetical protein [Phaeodactylibacter sp.]
MIVKRNFHPLSVWAYIKYQMLFVLSWSLAVWLVFDYTGEQALAINFTPIGILGVFTSESLLPYSWLIIPMSLLIAGVFIIMEKTGAANEDPFENKVTDVALSSICNTIERNLRELLGETDLPEKLVPKDGYLY